MARVIEVRRHLAASQFALVVSTGVQRATHTAANVLAGPGGPSIVASSWRRGCAPTTRTAGRRPTRRLARAWLADGGPVIGHSSSNEAAVLGQTGATVAPIGKGEAVVPRSHLPAPAPQGTRA